MSNIGFYIHDNKYAILLNSKIPEMLYYTTSIKIPIDNQHFVNGFNKVETIDTVNMIYVLLRLEKSNKRQEVLNTIFDIGTYRNGTKELYYLFFLNALEFFPNTTFLLEYMENMKNHGMKFSIDYIIWCVNNQYEYSFITKFNHIIFQSGMNYQFNINTLDQNLVVMHNNANKYIFKYPASINVVKMIYPSRTNETVLNNIILYISNKKWKHPTSYIIDDLQNFIDIYTINKSYYCKIMDTLIQHIYIIQHIYNNADIKFYHIHKHKVNLSNFIINFDGNYETKLLSMVHIMSLIEIFIKCYCKNYDIPINTSYIYSNYSYIFNYIFPSPQRQSDYKMNLNNYLFGSKFALEYDDVITIPYVIKKETNESIDEKKEDNSIQYYYGNPNSYR